MAFPNPVINSSLESWAAAKAAASAADWAPLRAEAAWANAKNAKAAKSRIAVSQM
jgi:hypothetical protein